MNNRELIEVIQDAIAQYGGTASTEDIQNYFERERWHISNDQLCVALEIMRTQRIIITEKREGRFESEIAHRLIPRDKRGVALPVHDRP